MKYTKLFIVLATVFVSFTSCSSGDDGDEPTNPTPTIPAKIPLTVEVTELPMTDAAAAREGMTRTDITYLRTLTHFKMDYHKSDDLKGYYGLNKSNNQWTVVTENPYWPSSDCYPFCFYAYTAGTFNWDGRPYIHLDVEENAFEQKDLLVAKSVEYSKAKESAVNLTFDHICAAVGFTIKMTDKLKDKLGDYTLQVTSVKLQNIVNNGDYYYDSGWAENTSDVLPAYYTITAGPIPVTTTQTEMKDLQGNPFYLFMIPQTCTASLEVKYKIGESGQEKTTTIGGININWQQGYRYYIDINLGTANIQV